MPSPSPSPSPCEYTVEDDRAAVVQEIRNWLSAMPKQVYPTLQELDADEYDADSKCQ